MKTLAGLVLLCCSAAGAETFTYWIEPCTRPDSECEAGDVELAEWAVRAWQTASSGTLAFSPSDLGKARIRLYWASKGNQGLYGEARPITVDGKRGAEVFILPGLSVLGQKEDAGKEDKLLRQSIVYLTCLHELGHALGLPHTRAFADIMYSFGYGGDIVEYFGRYRRNIGSREDIRKHPGLSADDTRRLQAIYKEQ